GEVQGVWEAGCRFDGWSEFFDPEAWHAALESVGVDAHEHACRPRREDEPLPWDHLDSGVTREFLWRERERASRGQVTADCRWAGCPGCGVCPAVGADPGDPGRKGRPSPGDDSV
ncbi:MAG: B12-binding domain-containing radical SAM protein, partial [Bacillota bacterium]